MKISTNKLSVYLIKKECSEHSDILKKFDELENKTLDIGTFYYGESHSYPPNWIEKFFGTSLGNEVKLLNSSSKGILLVEIDAGNNEKRIFAIAFGYGWQYLKQGVYEERFGLKTALSVIDPDNLRKIEKKNMSAAPKDTSEQLSKAGIAADFGIDIEQDLICSITGNSKDKDNFGQTVTGRDALSLSVKINFSNIKDFLKLCYAKYISDDYKKDFGWIDQIAEIKDPKIKLELDAKLIQNLKENSLSKTWMAIPQVIEWECVSGFRYTGKKNDELKDDIHVADFLNTLSEEEKNKLDIDFLKKKTIYCIGSENDEDKYHWSAYSCIYCEEIDEEKNKTYLLSNGKWYEIEKEFAQEVNDQFQVFRNAGSSLSLPKFNKSSHENEGKYNDTIADGDENMFSMDRKIISHGGGYGKIEFCDLITKDKKIIHVKHYGQSSVLSHLFSQGLVSGELFLRDNKFREKVNEKLDTGFKINGKPKASDYEVVFGIISSSPHDLEVPFFSKVNLRNAKLRLETFGYKVSLLKIEAENN